MCSANIGEMVVSSRGDNICDPRIHCQASIEHNSKVSYRDCLKRNSDIPIFNKLMSGENESILMTILFLTLCALQHAGISWYNGSLKSKLGYSNFIQCYKTYLLQIFSHTSETSKLSRFVSNLLLDFERCILAIDIIEFVVNPESQ